MRGEEYAPKPDGPRGVPTVWLRGGWGLPPDLSGLGKSPRRTLRRLLAAGHCLSWVYDPSPPPASLGGRLKAERRQLGISLREALHDPCTAHP